MIVDCFRCIQIPLGRQSVSKRASVVDLMVGSGGSKSTSWPPSLLSLTTTTLLAGSTCTVCIPPTR